MKVSNELKSKIATFISNGKTVDGFNLLIQLGFKDAALLKANYLAAKKEYTAGRASFDEYSRKVAMAHQGMLSLCDAEVAPDMDGITVYKNAEKAKPQKEEDILRNGVLHNPEFLLAHYGKALRLTHPALLNKLYEQYMKLATKKARCAFGIDEPVFTPVLDEKVLALIVKADAELRKLKNDWKENVKQLIPSQTFPTPENIAKALEICQANGLLTNLKFNVELSGWAIQAQILQQITTAIQ